MTPRLIERYLAAGLLLLSVAACSPQVDESPAAPAPRAAPANEVTAREEPERAVVAETLAYAEVNKKLVYGHFTFPEDMVEPLPAVVMIHEWWGLNPSVRQLADRLAAEGFIVLAVDLFDGATASTAPDARQLMLGVVERPESAERNIVLAVEWLLETTGAPKVATVGFGFGGGWSLHSAGVLGGRLDAAIMYYGQVSDDEQTLSGIEAPLLGFFGSSDTAVPEQSVKEFEAALEGLGKTYVIEMYEGVKGGFADTNSRNFNPELASASWEKTVDFLHEHLAVEQAR